MILLAALALASPAAALATSAGDQQYTDPLAGTHPTGTHPTGTAPGSTHRSTHSTTSESSAPSPSSTSSGTGSSSSGVTTSSSPSPRLSASASTSTSGSTSSTVGGRSGAGTLPYTGMNVWLVALLGAGMAGGGVLVRRRAQGQ